MRGDQDGRIEGHGAHLLPQIHQKHIYMWNSFHRIPIGSLQKSSNKAVRSPLNQVGPKEKEEE